MSVDKEAIVRNFIGQFAHSWPNDMVAALEPLADDAYYQMVVPTFEACKGKEAVIQALQAMMLKVKEQKHEMINVACSGDVVFTERVDYSLRDEEWVPIPLVAVF